MSISVIDPISHAVERTTRILFKPFELKKWFLLGFCAWLAFLGEGASRGVDYTKWTGGPGGGPFGPPGGPGGPGGGPFGPPAEPGGGPSGFPGQAPTGMPGVAQGGLPPFFQDALNWIQANMWWVLAFVLSGLILIMGLSALLTWLRSRGKFMFLDGVTRNREAVVEPWRQFRQLGNSLFGFTYLMTVFSILCLVVIAAISGLIAWPDIESQVFGTSVVAALIVCGLLSFATILFFAVVNLLLENFVVPTMYLRRELVMEAWSTVRAEVLSDRVGTIVLFFLMKFLLYVIISVIGVMMTCLTCCIAGLPYVGTVILLPLYVFGRCYSLCFLEQFGDRWRFFVDYGWPPTCLKCGYDLRGSVSGICPECGTTIPVPQAYPTPGEAT